MAVNWGLAGEGFDALQSLQVAGQARQQQLEAQRQQAILAQQQRALQARQQASAQYQQGDVAGAQSTALAAGDDDFVKTLGSMEEAHRKQTLDGFKQLGEYALLADTPAKWDAYVDDFVRQGHPEAAGYRGQFGMREQILARAGMANEYRKSQQVDYKVIPPGGYLQGFRADGTPLGDVQTAPPAAAPAAYSGGGGELERHAQEAIAAGADPTQVYARLRQMQGGAPSQGGATFR